MNTQLAFPDVTSAQAAGDELAKTMAALTSLFEAKRGALASLHSVGTYLLEKKKEEGSGFPLWFRNNIDEQFTEAASRSMTIAKAATRADLIGMDPTSIDRQTQRLLKLDSGEDDKEPALPKPLPQPTAFCSNLNKWVDSVESRYGSLNNLPPHDQQQIKTLMRGSYEKLRDLFEGGTAA